MAIVVTPAATAVVVAKAGTTVMTVESVRVATPPRVPEVAWAPLREWPGGLGNASRFQTDEPEARGNDKCRYCNASNVFHAQFVPSELLNLRMSGHLISLCNARVMLIFAICGRRDCCRDAAETDGLVRKAQVDAGSVPG